MTTTNKLVEDFRAKIKGIFKESAEIFDPEEARAKETPANKELAKQVPKPTVDPKIGVFEAGEPLAPETTDATAVDGDVAGAEVPVEEEKVTLTVSLLKSLLDWAHGEEELEGPEAEGEIAPEGEVAPEAAPVTEEEVAPEAAPEVAPEGEIAPEGEEAAIESIEIQALVDKVKELASTKGELTDEDFGEIVAAAQAAEDGAEGGEDLAGVMGDEGAAAPEAEPVTEDIGQVVPAGVRNTGNKGIGK